MRWLAAFAVVLCSVSAASAGNLGPTATMIVDGETVDVPLSVDAKGRFLFGDDGQGFEIDGGDYLVNLNGLLDPDPSISYGIAIVDFGAPSSFAFVFSTPIVPTPGPTLVRSSVSGGLTDQTGDGVSLTPTGTDDDGDTVIELQINEAGAPLVNMGVDIGGAAVFGPGAAGALYPYGPVSIPFQLGPTPGPYTSLTSTVRFMLSGGGDIAALTGYAEIITVPEPSTLALAGFGALALLVARRRARS